MGDWAGRFAAAKELCIALEVVMGVSPARREACWSPELFLAACCDGLVPLAGWTLGGGEEERGRLIDTAQALGQLRPSWLSRVRGMRSAWRVVVWVNVGGRRFSRS